MHSHAPHTHPRAAAPSTHSLTTRAWPGRSTPSTGHAGSGATGPRAPTSSAWTRAYPCSPGMRAGGREGGTSSHTERGVWGGGGAEVRGAGSACCFFGGPTGSAHIALIGLKERGRGTARHEASAGHSLWEGKKKNKC